MCTRRGRTEPLALSDNNPNLWGSRVEGVEVLPPAVAAARFGKRSAFAVTIWSPGHSYRETHQQLTGLGCKTIVPALPMLWKYADALLPHYCFDLPHRILEDRRSIRDVYGFLADEESRRQFLAQLNLRLWADFDGLPVPSPGDRYFPSGLLSPIAGECFIDGGAYTGDTIREFVALSRGSFRRIAAFEPDPSNCSRLRETIVSLGQEYGSRVQLFEAALGSRGGRVRFDASGETGAAVCDQGAYEVKCMALDEALAGEVPTFLKLDVEGAEQDALAGARDLILRVKPAIAVCVYHRPKDLWRIPLHLYSLWPAYKFYLRSHGYDGLDTVLYAIPPDRVKLDEASPISISESCR